MKSEFNKIRQLVSDETWQILQETNAIIAGGAITSVYTNQPVNDLDVYFKSSKDLCKFIGFIYSNDNHTYPSKSLTEIEKDIEIGEFQYALRVVNISDKSVMCIDARTQQVVQLITFDYFNSIQAIFDKFDFTVCMGALDCKSETFQFHTDFFKHNAQRYLEFNIGTAFPIISLLRVQKYVAKGYTISKSQLLRIVFRITQLEMKSWKDVREHCGGMYGMDLLEIFPDEDGFSIDKVIEKLSNVVGDIDNSPREFSTPSFGEILERLHIVNDDRESVKGRFFKNVKRKSDTEFSSFHKSDFIYRLGEVVDGGYYGLWMYEGVDVYNGTYSSHGVDSYIIELEPVDVSKEELSKTVEDLIRRYSPYGAKGKFKVVAAYTRDEFVTKFK